MLFSACAEFSESRREESERRSLLPVNEHFQATSNAESGNSEQALFKPEMWFRRIRLRKGVFMTSCLGILFYESQKSVTGLTCRPLPFRALTVSLALLAALSISACGSKPRLFSLKSSPGLEESYRSTRWLDGRAKLMLDPQTDITGLTHDNLVRAWLRQEAVNLQISPRLEGLRLAKVRRSARGIHYEFVTPDGAGSVLGSVLMVSLTADGTRIYRAYNGLAPKMVHRITPTNIRLSKEDAIAAAWNHLHVTGKLLREPTAELINDEIGGVRQTWWLVSLESTTPAGSWEYAIDPATGVVAKIKDRRIYDVSLDDARRDLALRPRRAATKARYEAFEVTGTARLFAVDPRTALNSESLKDDSDPALFEPAYETRPLDGLSRTSAGFELLGRRVTLTDWDSPFTPVSVSADGNWTANRGQDSFNDAMTWWHLDDSIKNIEGLGFINESRIFEGALIADPNGFDGQDNSFFTPTINALSFGHGCIDDNEDPDVILHEMGHAINYAINPYFTGGDTGAMGEGFGDYWAISHGFSDGRNRVGDKFRVFNWDGSADCWAGRRADRVDAKFKRGNRYDAHEQGPDGTISDELWSTPLVMALDELMTQNVPKEDVDLIVLESQFGLAHGLTMIDWSTALVQTASMLFPNGPHAGVFERQFKKHLIMAPRTPEIVFSGITFGNAGANHLPDPGETLDISLELFNMGDAAADGVSATLASKSDWVSVVQPEIQFGNIEDLKKVSGQSPFQIAIKSDAYCGSLTQLEAKVTGRDGLIVVVPLEFPLGLLGAEVDSQQDTPNLNIPDHDVVGTVAKITANFDVNAFVREGFTVDVVISHPSVTDLKIVLTSPVGHEIILKSYLSGQREDTGIIGIYPTTLHPVEDFASLIGTPLNGEWSLRVVDGFEGGVGKIVGWGIRNPTGQALCER
jgi:subtilisin-like proprotein convertase family protein